MDDLDADRMTLTIQPVLHSAADLAAFREIALMQTTENDVMREWSMDAWRNFDVGARDCSAGPRGRRSGRR